MNQKQMREVAIRTARSEARRQGYHSISAKSALFILDDISREEPDLIASKWYINASDNQIKLFNREWQPRL